MLAAMSRLPPITWRRLMLGVTFGPLAV